VEKYSLQGKDAPGKDNGLILVGPVDSTVLDAFRTDFSGALAHFGFPPCPGNIMMRNPDRGRCDIAARTEEDRDAVRAP
jgi:hypothetical protein